MGCGLSPPPHNPGPPQHTAQCSLPDRPAQRKGGVRAAQQKDHTLILDVYTTGTHIHQVTLCLAQLDSQSFSNAAFIDSSKSVLNQN